MWKCLGRLLGCNGRLTASLVVCRDVERSAAAAKRASGPATALLERLEAAAEATGRQAEQAQEAVAQSRQQLQDAVTAQRCALQVSLPSMYFKLAGRPHVHQIKQTANMFFGK